MTHIVLVFVANVVSVRLIVYLLIIAFAIIVELSVLLFRSAVPSHDRLVRCFVAVLELFIAWVKFTNAFVYIEADSLVALLRLFRAMVSVP